jgi:hypothetical protein
MAEAGGGPLACGKRVVRGLIGTIGLVGLDGVGAPSPTDRPTGPDDQARARAAGGAGAGLWRLSSDLCSWELLARPGDDPLSHR